MGSAQAHVNYNPGNARTGHESSLAMNISEELIIKASGKRLSQNPNPSHTVPPLFQDSDKLIKKIDKLSNK